MRDFFIGSFEKLVGVIVVLICLAVVIGGVLAMLSGQPGSLFGGLAILVGGAVYAILIGGMLYLFLGIYNNTKRTAEAVERLLENR